MASSFTNFFAELKRRRVWRVAAAYGATALATALAVSELYDDVGLPEGTPRIVIIVLAVGFPLALALAWAYDVTPEGVKRDAGPEHAPEAALRSTTTAGSGPASYEAAAPDAPTNKSNRRAPLRGHESRRGPGVLR